MTRRFITMFLLLLLATFSLPVQAQSEVPSSKAAPESPAADALVVTSAGLDRMLVDPKDQNLLAALRMLDERIAELPAEVNDQEMPAAAIQFAMQLLAHPISLRAGPMPGQFPDGTPKFYAQLNFMAADQASAENLAGRFAGMTAGMLPQGQPAPDMPGLRRATIDGVTIYQGVMNIGGQPSFGLAVNKASLAPPASAMADLPNGVEPIIAFSLRGSKLQGFFDQVFAQMPPSEIAAAKAQFTMMGLYGPHALDIHGAAGYAADRSHAALRYVNYGQLMEKTLARPTTTLTSADLARIPADATYAAVSRFNLPSIGRAMAAMAPPEFEGDPMDMIEQQTGIHPQRDIFDHLGEAAGYYMSQTTGGGALSTVAFVQVKDPASLNQTLQRINGTINQLAQQHARGYIRIAESRYADHTLTVLTFPGLPVPLEICWMMQDGYLYAAATPSALIAGLQHAKSGGSGLAENPRFLEMAGARIDGAMQVMFVDTPILLRSGYGLASLGMSAIANAVRSPRDPARSAGLIMPTIGELSQGAKAAVYITRLEGNDLVLRAQGDRSALVNACGAIGMMGGSTGAIAVAALSAGVMMPALAKAREAAKQTKSASQLRAIGMACTMYAADHDGAMPPNLQALLDGKLLTADLLRSPMGPVFDRGADYWIDFTARKAADVQFPDKMILGYDRAMYARGGTVNVLFFDGHVERLESVELDALMADPSNVGTDFDRPFDD